MRLNIGSHNVRVKDFLNVDIFKLPEVDIVCDITQTPWNFHYVKEDIHEFPYKDTVDEMLMVEVLEHISFHDTMKVLKEIHRVLVPGGKIHIQVPDCGSMMEMYVKEQISAAVPHKPKSEQEVLDIYAKTGMRVNPMRWLMAFCGAQKYGVPDIHKNIFTKEILQVQLEDAGFSRIDFKDDPLGWKIKCNATK